MTGPDSEPLTYEIETVDLATPDQPVSLRGYSPPTKPWDPEQHKAQSATTVARAIVGTFMGSIAAIFILMIIILLVSSTVDEAKEYAAVVVAILEGLGNFLTAVFAPLLAFVLGYYFGEKSGGK